MFSSLISHNDIALFLCCCDVTPQVDYPYRMTAVGKAAQVVVVYSGEEAMKKMEGTPRKSESKLAKSRPEDVSKEDWKNTTQMSSSRPEAEQGLPIKAGQESQLKAGQEPLDDMRARSARELTSNTSASSAHASRRTLPRLHTTILDSRNANNPRRPPPMLKQHATYI